MMNLIMEMLFIFFTDNTKRLCTGKIYFWIDFRNNVLLLGTVISLVVIGITKQAVLMKFFNSRFFISYYFIDFINHASFILKFGGEKGRIAIIGVMGFIFVIGLLLIKLLNI